MIEGIDKEELLKLTLKYITSPIITNLHNRRKDLIKKNYQLGGSESGYFIHGNLFSTKKKILYQDIRKLHGSLIVEHDELIQEDKEFHRNYKVIHQGLSTLFVRCTTAQDVRDMLPDIIFTGGSIGELFKPFKRTREEAFSLVGSPSYDKYLKVKDLIETYLAYHFIYST